MTRRTVLSLLAVVALTAAADKPNFSGMWKMNPAKSNFGQMPMPEKLERTIFHVGSKLYVRSVTSSPQGELKSESTYTTDGKESVNTARGVPVKSVATWEGSTLVIRSKRQVRGMEIGAVEHWTLSPDGQVLTVVNNISGPQGDIVATTVMDRQ